jgi:hypothetical protein
MYVCTRHPCSGSYIHESLTVASEEKNIALIYVHTLLSIVPFTYVPSPSFPIRDGFDIQLNLVIPNLTRSDFSTHWEQMFQEISPIYNELQKKGFEIMVHNSQNIKNSLDVKDKKSNEVLK